MDFQQIINDYGYIAVFIGSLVEGESVILTAGAMSYHGLLSLPGIMIVAFFGTFIADQVLYVLGRKYGDKFFQRWPKYQGHTDKAMRLLQKYDTLFILSYRFVYGFRVVGSAIIGMCGVPPRRFFILNGIAAIIWSILSCSAGYFIGFGLDKILVWLQERFSQTTIVCSGIALGASVLALSGFLILRKRRRHLKTKVTDAQETEPHLSA